MSYIMSIIVYVYQYMLIYINQAKNIGEYDIRILTRLFVCSKNCLCISLFFSFLIAVLMTEKNTMPKHSMITDQPP